jgi:hypothetical protein
MDEHGISELEAAIRIADQISASRRRWQNRFSPAPVATPSQPQGVRP